MQMTLQLHRGVGGKQQPHAHAHSPSLHSESVHRRVVRTKLGRTAAKVEMGGLSLIGSLQADAGQSSVKYFLALGFLH